MTALQVDATQVVVDVLAAALDARVLTNLPADNPAGSFMAGLPYVRPIRIGGPDDGHVLDSATFTIHTFATTDQEANALSYQAVAALRAATAVVDGAVITQVNKLGGPSWAGTDNQALHHAATNVQIRIKIA